MLYISQYTVCICCLTCNLLAVEFRIGFSFNHILENISIALISPNHVLGNMSIALMSHQGFCGTAAIIVSVPLIVWLPELQAVLIAILLHVQ